jgi:hypothetical protein
MFGQGLLGSESNDFEVIFYMYLTTNDLHKTPVKPSLWITLRNL